MYADDTQLFYSFPPEQIDDACRHINEDLSALHSVFLLHSLKMNPNKSEFILYRNEQNRLTLILKSSRSGTWE